MELLSTAQAAKMLGVSPNTVKKYIRHGLIEAFRPAGTRYKIPRENVEKFLENSKTNTSNEGE